MTKGRSTTGSEKKYNKTFEKAALRRKQPVSARHRVTDNGKRMCKEDSKHVQVQSCNSTSRVNTDKTQCTTSKNRSEHGSRIWSRPGSLVCVDEHFRYFALDNNSPLHQDILFKTGNGVMVVMKVISVNDYRDCLCVCMSV